LFARFVCPALVIDDLASIFKLERKAKVDWDVEVSRVHKLSKISGFA
jgi:hypothetical protein